MMLVTKEILDAALNLARKHCFTPERAISEAFSDSLGFGSTDSFTRAVLCELHLLGMLLEHNIK